MKAGDGRSLSNFFTVKAGSLNVLPLPQDRDKYHTKEREQVIRRAKTNPLFLPSGLVRVHSCPRIRASFPSAALQSVDASICGKSTTRRDNSKGGLFIFFRFHGVQSCKQRYVLSSKNNDTYSTT